MRKDRYVTVEEYSDADMLTDLEWSIDPANIVRVSWSWPRNRDIKLAAVFVAESSDDTLERLLHNMPDIVTKDINKLYSKPLDSGKRQFRVFPAYFGEGSDIMLINQKSGNITGVITRLITVNYKLDYKDLALRDYRCVRLNISCTEALSGENALIYSKYKDGMHICDYPLGNTGGSYTCYIKQNETIKLYASEHDSGIRLIRKEG